MDQKQIDKIIKIYLNDLSKKIKIAQVILFGSAARGEISRDGDIDLLILSPSFSNKSTDKRFDLLYSARTNPFTQKVPMDIFGLTPKEYHQASTLSTVGEIKETGKTIDY